MYYKVKIRELQIFSKKKMQTLYPHLISIKQGYNPRSISIDAKQHTLQYTSRDEEISILKFRHMVAADGGQHAMVDLLL